MIARRPLALLMLVAALAVAMPTAAFAQSAGDNQYQDPLQGNTGSTPSKPQSSPSAGSSGSGSTPAPSPRATRSVPLARTGFDALIPGVAGVLLLAGGAVLLVRARRASA